MKKVFKAKKFCARCGVEFDLTAPSQQFCKKCAILRKLEGRRAARLRAAERIRRESAAFAARHGLDRPEIKLDKPAFEFVQVSFGQETKWQYRGQKPAWRR